MELRVGAEPERRAATWIAHRLGDSARRRGTASLALSGGGTAQPMIDALADSDVPWGAVTIWQVDERIAPDGHEARNAGQLETLSVLPCRVRAMPVTAADLRAAARRYAASLPDRFDVVHLGLGSDGHTASWPPQAPEIGGSSRPVEITDTFNGWRRMTLTGAVVNQARSRAVLVVGPAKQPVVERWLLEDVTMPICGVRRTQTWVFLDAAAAPRGAPQ